MQDKIVIGTRGTSSEATANHLAFTYYEHLKLLALPMAICEESNGGGDYGDVMTFNGLLVFEVDPIYGVDAYGDVDHMDEADQNARRGCSNWWTNAKSQVERSIIMDDYVFSISREIIKVNHLNSLSTDIASLSVQ